MKIGLFGFDFVSPNKGCEALTYTVLSMLERLNPKEKYEIVNFTYNDDMGEIPTFFPKMRFKRFKICLKDPRFTFKALQEMKECKFFMDATFGDGFSDIYGVKWNIKTDLIKQLVIMSGTTLVLVPQTYGPYSHKIMGKWAMKIIRNAGIVYARDDASAQYVKELSRNEIKVASDLAFNLPYDQFAYVRKNRSKIAVGVNISSLLWDGDWASQNRFGLTVNYQEFCKRIIEYLLERNNQYEIHLIPHVVNEKKPESRANDYRACEEVHQSYQETILAPMFKNPIEAKSYISNMDVFTGARMHATIGALSSGVATIPFSYSRKFEGLFGSLDYHYVISATHITTNEAVDSFIMWLNDYETLKKKGMEASHMAIERLDQFEDAIRSILK